MLPILRSRPSQVLVALLCALVLSRMPAPVFAEDTLSSLVNIEDSAAIAGVMAPAAGISVWELPRAIPVHAPTRSDAPNHSLLEHSILRL